MGYYKTLPLAISLVWCIATTTAHASAPENSSVGSEAPTLARVFSLARERAPEVVVAKAGLEASRSVSVGARLSPLLNPYVEVISEHGRGVTRDVYVTAQVHTPIEIAGQRSRRVAEADAFIQWNTATLEHARAQVSGAAVRTYGEYLAWSARYETLTELLHSATTEAKVLLARRNAGDATERDAQLAEVERARIAVQVDEAMASRGTVQNELARLTGQSFAPPDQSRLFPEGDFKGAGVTHAPTAPAVLGAQAEARYHARQDERLERERIPPLSVIFQAGRGDFGEARLGAGLAWSLPVFRYNQGERAKAQAEGARARIAASTYQGSIALRLRSISEAIGQLRVAVERLDHEAIPAAAMATESAARMYLAGKTDLLSVVVARRDFYLLRMRRMEIAEHIWALVGDWVELTGKLP